MPALFQSPRSIQNVHGLLIQPQTILDIADILILQTGLAGKRYNLIVEVFGLHGDLVGFADDVFGFDFASAHNAHQHVRKEL